MKIEEFLSNPYAVEKVIRNKVGDRKLIEGLEKYMKDGGANGSKILE
jgi:hypothetical protein